MTLAFDNTFPKRHNKDIATLFCSHFVAVPAAIAHSLVWLLGAYRSSDIRAIPTITTITTHLNYQNNPATEALTEADHELGLLQ